MTSSLGQSIPGVAPVEWASRWLVELAKPATVENLRAVVSWEYAESGGGGGMWNPLNTTQAWPDSTCLNSVCVRNYRTLDDGLAANAHALRNGYYGPILAALTAGNDAARTATAIVQSPWGTRHIVLVPASSITGVPGVNIPQTPAPVPLPRELDMIALPSHIPGQVGSARAVSGFNLVYLDGGGRLAGDQPTGSDRWWAPNDPLVHRLPPGSLVGIADMRPLGQSRLVAFYDIGSGDVRSYVTEIVAPT